MKKNQTYRELFSAFFKIGAFTFGGGYAMIPLIQKEASERKGWITKEDILEIIAIAESTPGPIAINAATFIGSRVAGFPGAVCATLGVVLPSFCIIAVIACVLRYFEELKAIEYAFWGIRAGVLALLVKAFFSMGGQCPKNVMSWLIAGGAFLAAVLGVNVIVIIVACALVGWTGFRAMSKESAQTEKNKEKGGN